MSKYFLDIGWKSIRHAGEELCGDHVDVIDDRNGNMTAVIADGLGSGVRASILSTLTSKIISTMIAEGLPLEECVSTIASTLPVMKDRNVAYSTFTILHVKYGKEMHLVQYDNPSVILLRNGEVFDYEKQEMHVEEKTIYSSSILLEEGDMFIAMSDGCPCAGPRNTYNLSWQVKDIASYMQCLYFAGYDARTLSNMLVEECNHLYEYKPADDATAFVLSIKQKKKVNVLFGPPKKMEDTEPMIRMFFAEDGIHVVSGGSTSRMVAEYLDTKVIPSMQKTEHDIPPISTIRGVDLTTEGVVTMNRVAQYAEDHIQNNAYYEQWSTKQDGASLISRLLFEKATDIHIFVGTAINPAHQNPDLAVSFNLKLDIVNTLKSALEKMGKNVSLSVF